MKYLTRFAFALILLVCTGLSACKKEQTEKTLPKIKSISNWKGSSATFKIEFEYTAAGQLSRINQFEKGMLTTYTEYFYVGNVLSTARSFAKNANRDDQLLAESQFTFNGARLMKLIVGYNNSGSVSQSTQTLTFDYTAGELPKMTIVTSGLKPEFPQITNPGAGTYYIHQYDGNSTEEPLISDLKTDLAFDNHVNPLQNLPALYCLEIASLFGNSVYTQYFNAPNFFHPHNIVRQFSSSGALSFECSYSYNQQGLPVKCITKTYPFQTSKETVYEYW